MPEEITQSDTPVVKPITTTKAEAKAPPTFNEARFIDTIVSVEKFYGQWSGKPGYNPYIYLQREVAPLFTRYQKGERSVELLNAALKLEKDEKHARLPGLTTERKPVAS